MATKAETFRYWAERSGPKRPKAPPRPPPRAPAASGTAVGGAVEGKQLEPRRASARAAKKALYRLEVTEGRPSRKSTRKAANRQRTDVQMRVKLRTAEVRPAPRGLGR